MSSKGLAIIIGAGPGTGASVARAFSQRGYSIAVLARNKNSLDELTNSINAVGGEAKSFQCDVTSEESITSAFKAIGASFPNLKVKVGVFNVGNFVKKPFLEIDREVVEHNLKFIAGAFTFSQQVIKAIKQHNQGGTLIFSGASAAIRGNATYSVFTVTKSAIRALSQSIAKEFGPQGIHVAHVVLDGVFDTEKAATFLGPAVAGTRINVDEIAKAYVYLHEQEKSCWTYELDLRPSTEKF
ncbi:hypothetical protein HDU76_008648 [Blyttiomyces sp. JEL0837]|nr:hypothetical protein HDU76_008648 [Blyttiomyces sp. JEL0837]